MLAHWQVPLYVLIGTIIGPLIATQMLQSVSPHFLKLFRALIIALHLLQKNIRSLD